MKEKDVGAKFNHLVEIMAHLRGPQGCPWDREQTHQSLRQYLLEEAYEVLEAIDNNDPQHLAEEMGDLLLQVLFHAQIASEAGTFKIGSVIETISEKLIRRHPNVFGDTVIKTAAEQSVNWEKIKKAEGKKSTIDGVPAALSALLRAWRIQQKAATVGFDWKKIEPVWDKIHEETEELREAIHHEDQEQMEEEFGDLLFSLVNLSRFLDVNPEDALRRTTNKFARRFRQLEAEFHSNGASLHDLTLEDMDSKWNEIKRAEKAQPAARK